MFGVSVLFVWGCGVSELTYDLANEIADEVEKGNYPEVVAGSLGIDKAYFSRSWTLGLEVKARPGFPDEGCSEYEVLCAVMADQLEVAGARAELQLVEMMLDHAERGKPTWTAYMTILERTRPGWQRREKFEAPGGRSVEDELAEIEERARRRDAES
jgi:hypothetical protein